MRTIYQVCMKNIDGNDTVVLFCDSEKAANDLISLVCAYILDNWFSPYWGYGKTETTEENGVLSITHKESQKTIKLWHKQFNMVEVTDGFNSDKLHKQEFYRYFKDAIKLIDEGVWVARAGR